MPIPDCQRRHQQATTSAAMRCCPRANAAVYPEFLLQQNALGRLLDHGLRPDSRMIPEPRFCRNLFGNNGKWIDSD
jgi:hypothetical protein